MPAKINIPAGTRYGRWVVLGEAKSRPRGDRSVRRYLHVQCDCGALGEVKPEALTAGKSTQCNRCINITHALSRTPEYRTWLRMRDRCGNPNAPRYKDYGGRGITVCERWATFENFIADMGQRPEGMSIDRIDNDGNYEPSNCRWATLIEQARNKRNNRHLTLNGRTQCVAEWAEELGIKKSTIYGRLGKGWSAERVLSKAKQYRS